MPDAKRPATRSTDSATATAPSSNSVGLLGVTAHTVLSSLPWGTGVAGRVFHLYPAPVSCSRLFHSM
eukprot:scaffold24143_cov146-Isochrysis_galbana.AAC.1